jgi:hypothetical protein
MRFVSRREQEELAGVLPAKTDRVEDTIDETPELGVFDGHIMVLQCKHGADSVRI